MADSATTTITPTAPQNFGGSAPQGSRRHGATGSEHNSRGGQNRGTYARGSRPARGGRGRGRGANRTTPIEGDLPTKDGERPDPQQAGNFGTRLTKAASQIQDVLGVQSTDSRDRATSVAETETDVCFICASIIDHISIAPCNHQTCHICALRLRALYKTKACAHCRTESDFVIFTDTADKRYQDFSEFEFARDDENLGIRFEKNIILEDTILLLRYNCPDKDCEVQCLSWPDLHRHVKTKHGKIMCDLCTKNKKVFTHEHELFTYGELRRHERFGDDNPGAIDQSGFKGHPECGFCKQRFYGDDELYTHCRERHERCHICDRRNQGRHPQYYLNYQQLEKHFAEVHFVCLDAECQANKTNVFESEMDLKAHQLAEHPNGLSKDARRDARLVNLSGFDLRTPYEPERRGGRRGGGRGRDPNTDPLPASSAQPIGRAELAYQRMMALQNAPTSSGRSFGGQLTPSAPAQRSQLPSSSQPAQHQIVNLPNLDTLHISSEPDHTSPSQPQISTPHEKARAERHTAVTARANSLLAPGSQEPKLKTFRDLISQYRASTITARDLVDQFASTVFAPATSSAELGKLVRELADLFESEPKRQALLEAWNSWKSINDEGDYPMLPLSSSTSTTQPNSGRRVLRLKSSTAPSQRSAVSRQASWGHQATNNNNNTTGSMGSSTNPFPSLPGSNQRNPASSAVPWGISSPSSSFRPSNNNNNNNSRDMTSSTSRQTAPQLSSRLNNNRPPTTTMGPKANDDMFPSLPTAKKPDVLMAGLTRGSVRWDNSSRRNGAGRGQATSTPSPWGGGSAPTPAQATSQAERSEGLGLDDPMFTSDAVDAGSKKKGKKAKAQMLYHFG